MISLPLIIRGGIQYKITFSGEAGISILPAGCFCFTSKLCKNDRVLLKVAPAVAAAVESNVARIQPPEPAAYVRRLEASLRPERELMRKIFTRAQQKPFCIVLPEGDHPVIIRAAYQALREGIARPLLLGNSARVKTVAGQLRIPLEGIDIMDPHNNPHVVAFE